MCQKLLDVVKAFKRYKQKYALAPLFWTTRYIHKTSEASGAFSGTIWKYIPIVLSHWRFEQLNFITATSEMNVEVINDGHIMSNDGSVRIIAIDDQCRFHVFATDKALNDCHKLQRALLTQQFERTIDCTLHSLRSRITAVHCRALYRSVIRPSCTALAA